MACVPAGPRAVQRIGGRVGELQGVVPFAAGQETGIAGDAGAAEFEAEAAVGVGSERVGMAVTRQKPTP